MIIAEVATKADLQVVRADLQQVRTELKTDFDHSLRELELRMTIKLGALIAAAVAIVGAIQKFL